MSPIARFIATAFLFCFSLPMADAQWAPPPTDLQGAFHDSVVSLQWQAPESDSAPSFYKVYRNSGWTMPHVIATTPGLSYVDDSIHLNTSYHYLVTAVFHDTLESFPSNIIRVFTGNDSVFDTSRVSITFTSHPPHAAAVGQLFQYTPTVTTMPPGIAVCFHLEDAPDGMTIDDSTGTIQWTPDHAGIVEVEIHARACSGSEGGAEQQFTLFVFSGSPGSVAGTVRNDSGNGLAGIRIKLFDVSEGEFELRTTTDSSGHYSFPFVNPSTYLVRAKPGDDSPYAPQWYNGVSDIDNATPVVVAESTTVTVDFTLHRPDTTSHRFTLSGMVTDTASHGLADARVLIFRTDRDTTSDDRFDDEDGHHGDRDPVREAETDSNGNYSVRLHEGTYVLEARHEGFLPQFWMNEPTPLQADHLHLTQDTTGINFMLHAREHGTGSISGVILSAKDSTALKAHVLGFQEDGAGGFTGFIAVTHTDSGGIYTLDHLPNGAFLVLADAGDDFVPTYYNTSGGTPFQDSATSVSVTGGAVTGISIYLSPDSVEGLNSISGDVSEGSSAQGKTTLGISGVGGATVLVTGSGNTVLATAVSQGDGSYLASGLAPGSYTLIFQKPGMTTVSAAATVTYVNNTPTTTIVNAQMASPTGSGPMGTLNVRSSWNLVSVPVTVTDAHETALFPSAVSQAFSFSGTYQAQTILQYGAGYWLKFPASQVISLTGTARTTETVTVSEGWNLIGTISAPVAIGAVSTSPSGLVTSSYFGYRSGYTIASTLAPGEGYWVKTSGSGSLTMSSGAHASAKGSVGDALSSMNTLVIRDAAGNSQTLYFGTNPGGVSAAMVEMPPVGPEGTFDARFGTSQMAEFQSPVMKSAVTYPIAIQGARWPVTVSWTVGAAGEGIAYRLNGGKTLTGSGTVKLVSPTALTLQAGPKDLPSAYALRQNYPNPFNPTTEIAFDLPATSVVTLKVYNLLGQEVTTLVKGETMEAGVHTAKFNASDLATGIYFYRLTANNFVSVRKMMLVR